MLGNFQRFFLVFSLGVSTQVFAQSLPVIQVEPRLATPSVNYKADDPALWIHPTDPEKSLLLGTDVGTGDAGGIFVWNLDGSLQQRVVISHPEHIDVRSGVQLGDQSLDIAVVAMRDHSEFWVFRIDQESRMLENITTADGIRIFSQPFGLGLYKRADGTAFVAVSGRTASSREGIWQLRLEDDGLGKVTATKVREFGDNETFVDGVLFDDELGYLYIAEEDSGIHKYYADPEKGDERLGFFASTDEFSGHRSGLALYACPDSTGYILVTNTGNNAVQVYRREGETDDPHQHIRIATIQNLQDEAGDGVDVTNFNLSPEFPDGFLIWLNKTQNNFQLYAWEDIAQSFLNICTESADPTSVGQETALPREIDLAQNYPNPFNPETEIRFQLPASESVQLIIYNLLGREIRRLVNQRVPAGFHVSRWDGKDYLGKPAASGVYIYRLKTNNFVETRRMVLLR